MLKPFGTQVETPQVLAVLDKLGETRVQRGYRAVVEPLPYGHSKWEVCFLALCFGPPGALDAEIRSRVEDHRPQDLLARGRRYTRAAAELLGLQRSDAALIVQWADRHAMEFRRLLEKWLGRRRGTAPIARASIETVVGGSRISNE